LRTAWRQRAAQWRPEVESGPPTTHSWWRAFGEGAIIQLANPKAAVFMMAFYPQFVPADLPLFRTPRVRNRLEAVTGTVLIGLGIRVAASSR
jgi:threonine/homoserine/homoserine lactone efflux protein